MKFSLPIPSINFADILAPQNREVSSDPVFVYEASQRRLIDFNEKQWVRAVVQRAYDFEPKMDGRAIAAQPEQSHEFAPVAVAEAPEEPVSEPAPRPHLNLVAGKAIYDAEQERNQAAARALVDDAFTPGDTDARTA